MAADYGIMRHMAGNSEAVMQEGDDHPAQLKRVLGGGAVASACIRSEEHTSELQSQR